MKIERQYGPPAPDETVFGYHQCRLCPAKFDKNTQITAWEIHKLNHTLVALKNIIDRYTSQGERLY